jgi:hypothetical protein
LLCWRVLRAPLNGDELVQGVAEWVEKKFHRPEKKLLMHTLWNGDWSSELVVNVVKSDEELKLIAGHGIKILRLNAIVESLASNKIVVACAGGGDIIDLIQMGSALKGGS